MQFVRVFMITEGVNAKMGGDKGFISIYMYVHTL